MSGSVNDGAGVSLSRQLSMIRFILKKNTKGLTFDEIDFHMTINHGVSSKWVTTYLKKWRRWGVVVARGTRFYVDADKWVSVLKARDEEATMLEG